MRTGTSRGKQQRPGPDLSGLHGGHEINIAWKDGEILILKLAWLNEI